MQQAMQIFTSKKTVEYYTPPEFIGMVRAVIGEIDLDPASAPLPQTWIQAKQYYSLDLSGFIVDPDWTEQDYKRELVRYSRKQLDAQPQWEGNVFLNSPFDNTRFWVARLIKDFEAGSVKNAIQLLNSNLGYNYYEDYWIKYPVCCVRDRIAFIREDGTQKGTSKQGQTFVLLTRSDEVLTRFQGIFSRIGRIILSERGFLSPFRQSR